MCDANVQASVFKSPGKFVWKGVKGVRVLLALVFVSFGNCSNMYLLVHISCLAKTCIQVRKCYETR